MYLDYDEKDIKSRLLNFIQTERYQSPDGCLQFIKRALSEFGINVEAVPGSSLRDGRLFERVDEPSFGTVVVWRNLPFPYTDKFHVGMMLDRRWCIQSSTATNGVARIDITRYPMCACEATFYRPKALK